MTPCPICRRPGEAAYRPFCSRRCRDRDFGRWIEGFYTVAGQTLSVDTDPYAADADHGSR